MHVCDVCNACVACVRACVRACMRACVHACHTRHIQHMPQSEGGSELGELWPQSVEHAARLPSAGGVHDPTTYPHVGWRGRSLSPANGGLAYGVPHISSQTAAEPYSAPGLQPDRTCVHPCVRPYVCSCVCLCRAVPCRALPCLAMPCNEMYCAVQYRVCVCVRVHVMCATCAMCAMRVMRACR